MELINCEYCGNLIKNNPHSIVGHYASCRKYRKFKTETVNGITKEFLQKEYINEEKSASEIARELKLRRQNVIFNKLKEFGIPRRTLKEEKHTKWYIKKTKETCKKKYGADYHTSKESSHREIMQEGLRDFIKDTIKVKKWQEKIQKTNLDRHGVKNGFNCEQTKITCIERYGVDNPWKNKEIIKKNLKTKYSRPQYYTHTSKLSQQFFWTIYNQLEQKNHIYFKELNKEFGKMTSDKKYYFYDFVDTENKKCIEFNGNYYHMNPVKYKVDDFNKRLNLIASDVWKRDKEKIDFLISEKYEVLTIWEKEYKENPQYVIMQCLDFLNHS
jgi:very-short-patch-repair endonuclease